MYFWVTFIHQYREVRAYAIPGGSEEIMLDLGIRQSIRVAEAYKQLSKL